MEMIGQTKWMIVNKWYRNEWHCRRCKIKKSLMEKTSVQAKNINTKELLSSNLEIAKKKEVNSLKKEKDKLIYRLKNPVILKQKSKFEVSDSIQMMSGKF